MKLYIKNMACVRCKTIVKSALERLGFKYIVVDLGEVEIRDEVTQEQQKLISETFKQYGLELIDDKKTKLIEQIKNAIIDLVYYNGEQLKVNFSDYITHKVNADYSYLSNLFSEVQGITIEKYFISQKIERAKELLDYEDLSLSEIADKLDYSSVAHLSGQFKKITGLTPSNFKKLRQKRHSTFDG